MLQTLRARPLIILLVIVFAAFLIQMSWAGDDAYITMRTVDNFIHGYGLRWNIDERVQVYTHPLWMFLLSGAYALIGDSSVTLMGLSILVSTVTVFLLLVTVPKNNFGLFLGWTSLMLSKAFIDYSNSGLENPATHLFLLIFALLYLQDAPQTPRQVFLLSLTAGLSVFNRLDTALFYIPALLQIIWSNRNRRTIGLILAGLTPIFLWEIFSLVYYGFFLPNTYYAKLTAGIPAGELTTQGVLYFVNSLTWNPVTLVLIFASGFIVFLGENRAERWLAAGVMLYLAYVVVIGGDFMSGRFFTAPFFLAVILLIRHVQEHSRLEKSVWLGVIIALGTILAPLNSTSSRDTTFISTTGIADESAGYYRYTNLILFSRGEQLPTHPWAAMGRELRLQKPQVAAESGVGNGMLGFFAGPEIHLVDRLALCDPLLARLPARHTIDWRIAHYERDLPDGYLETLASGQNQFQDPNLGLYYDKLHLITSGNLWSPQRWQAIWQMNTGYTSAH